MTRLEQAVVIANLSKQFKNGRGIRNISFSINQGEIIGILGPNGAGKTTLLKCMTGLRNPDSGRVTLFGNDLQKNFKQAITPVSALIGPTAAYENMTPDQNLKMISRLYNGIKKADIDKVLQQTGLIAFKNEKIHSFSMGMKQRFGIATTLISKPRLIILDEPTNGLDIDGLLLLRKTIQEVSQNEGVTFVISSHHISELEKICHRFCFLINGEASFYDANTQSLEEAYVEKMGRS